MSVMKLMTATSTSSLSCELVPAWDPVRKLTNSDVGCKTVANMIKGKSPEEIRKLFNIQNESVHHFDQCYITDIQLLIRGRGADPKRERVGRGVSPLYPFQLRMVVNNAADRFKLDLEFDHVVILSGVYIFNSNRMIMHVR
jgi:hypothetical protein